MREILTCKWEKPSIYRTSVGRKEWSTGCHRGEIWYVSVVEIGNHDGQYTEATLSQNKIYIHIYISIKLNNSLNFNQEIVELLKILKRNIYSFIYIFIYTKKKYIYLHISSTKLKDHTHLYKKSTKLSSLNFSITEIQKILFLLYKNKYRKQCPSLINKLTLKLTITPKKWFSKERSNSFSFIL